MSRQDTQPASVAELVELPHDSWVNAGFTAVARSIERKISKKTNKPFWVCSMADTTGSAIVELAMFTAPKFGEGDQVDFLGQGIKFKNGQYGPKVSVGDKTEIHVVGKSAHHAEQKGRADAGAPAVNGQPQMVLGQTVGMALKESLALVTMAHGGIQDGKPLKDPLFWQDVKQCASNIIRLSRSLEKGHLSPAPWPTSPKPETSGRVDPPKPAANPQPGPEGSAYDPSGEMDSDIPF